MIQLADAEARRLGDSRIDTHHLLLGLTKEGSGVGADILRNFEIPYQRIVEAIGATSPNPEMTVEAPAKYSKRTSLLPFTSQTDAMIELASEESRKLNHRYVGTEHLLLGICRQSESTACQILRKFQVEPQAVIEDTLVLLGAIQPIPREAREGFESILVALRTSHYLSDEKILSMTMEQVRALLEQS